jgi:hypothetical protein
MTKITNSKQDPARRERFGHWNLGFVWNLVLGILNFRAVRGLGFPRGLGYLGKMT